MKLGQLFIFAISLISVISFAGYVIELADASTIEHETIKLSSLGRLSLPASLRANVRKDKNVTGLMVKCNEGIHFNEVNVKIAQGNFEVISRKKIDIRDSIIDVPHGHIILRGDQRSWRYEAGNQKIWKKLPHTEVLFLHDSKFKSRGLKCSSCTTAISCNDINK